MVSGVPSSSPAAASPPTPAEIVERESSKRKPAAWAATAGVVLLAVAAVIGQILSSGAPDLRPVDLIQSIAALQAGQPVPTSFTADAARYTLDNGTLLVLVAFMRVIGFGLFGALVILLLRAARDRGGSIPSWAPQATIGGFAVLVLAGLVTGIPPTPGAAQVPFNAAVEDAGLTPGAARELIEGSWAWIRYGGIALNLAQFVVGIAVSVGAIQAMRVGLLPRFLGFMGVLVGILFVIPLDPTGFLIFAIWFGSVALLVAGRLGGGLPEAWERGVAVEPEPRQPPEPKAGKAGKAKKVDED